MDNTADRDDNNWQDCLQQQQQVGNKVEMKRTGGHLEKPAGNSKSVSVRLLCQVK